MLKHGVQETTTTTGTGTVTLVASLWARVSGRFSVGNLMDYLIEDANGNKEWGLGTVGAGNTLARTTITGTLAAGVYTAGGAPLNLSGVATVSCVEHEGSHPLLSAISATFVALGTQTNSFGAPSGILVDESGTPLTALSATVVPRTGTLASLLSLAGNDGEVASVIDGGLDALVKFDGTVGGAMLFVPSRHKGQAAWNATATAIASATLTPQPMAPGLDKPSGFATSLISVTTAQLTVTDVGQAGGFSAGNAMVEVWGYINFSASATPGTYAQVDFQLDIGGGLFLTFYSFVYPVVANVITTAIIPLIPQLFGSPMKIRLAVKHDATGNRTTNGTLNVAIPVGF